MLPLTFLPDAHSPSLTSSGATLWCLGRPQAVPAWKVLSPEVEGWEFQEVTTPGCELSSPNQPIRAKEAAVPSRGLHSLFPLALQEGMLPKGVRLQG